jgi:LysM repeat protein
MHSHPSKSDLATLFSGRAAAAVALAAMLAVGVAQAADKGARAHAEGKYDSVTATYLVMEGDDLFAISERFDVPVDTLRTQNKLTTTELKAGQKLNVGGAHAHKAASHAAATKKPLAKMTCEDFVGLDESFQPKAVYWAVAYGSKGQPEAEDAQVDGIETLTPVVVQECKKAPKESFWQKVKAEWAKMAQKF